MRPVVSSLLLLFFTAAAVGALIRASEDANHHRLRGGLGSGIRKAYDEALMEDELETLRVLEANPDHDATNTDVTNTNRDITTTRTIGAPCQLDFTFDPTKEDSGKRPNSAEIDTLLQWTKQFLEDQLSAVWPQDFVDLHLSELHVPMHVKAGNPQYSLTVRFLAKVSIRTTSALSNDDLADLLETLDYEQDYLTNYVWKATVGDKYKTFASASAVVYSRRAGREHKSIWGNPDDAKGNYFEEGKIKPYKHKPPDHWPSYYSHAAGKPCPKRNCNDGGGPTWNPTARDEHWPTRQHHNGG